MTSVDGSQGLKGASDEFHTNICGPCKIDDVEKKASNYCKDCLHYLCDNCKDYHRKIPLLKSHCIVPGSQVTADTFTSTRRRLTSVVYCSCNKNQEVQYYCDDHQYIICDSCKHTKHYNCKVSLIQDKGTSYNMSGIDTVISKIEALKAGYAELKKARADESKSLERSKEDCKKDIAVFRKEMNTLLDKLEKNMLEQLESSKNEVQTRIDKHMSTLTAIMKMIDSDCKLLKEARKEGRNPLMFAADFQVSKSLQDYEDRFSDINNESIDTVLTFEKNKDLANLRTEVDSLGSLIRSRARNIQRGRNMLLGSKIQSQKLVNVKLSGDHSPPWITGSVVMPFGEVVLCDSNNNKIKLLDNNDLLKDSLRLKVRPWDISVVTAKTVIVSMPWNNQLQYINVFPRISLGRVLQLDNQCYGVHVTRDKIFTSCQLECLEVVFRILDLDGNLIQQLGIKKDGSFLFTGPCYITVSQSENIFVSDQENCTVSCIAMNNRDIYHYRDNENKLLRGLCCDDWDNILVCGEKSNNVQLITAEGKKHCDFITSRDGLDKPCCISYRGSDNTLIIGCRNSDHVFLFKLEK